jgi:predicted TPR repeat methyltransferase
MTNSSLDATYFDGIFDQDDDPWNLASSEYEAAKFDQTIAALRDRRYAHALEIGCAHGVLTERLSGLCDRVLAVDISTKALAKAKDLVGDRPGVSLQRMAFPRETPDATAFDLVMLSEVAYYWGIVDLDRAAEWLRSGVAPSGRVMLVHWLGETDYPQTGDGAVAALWEGLSPDFDVERADRTKDYRLDVWTRR